MGSNEGSVNVLARTLLHMKLDLERLQALKGLRSAKFATLANQESSPAMLASALQILSSNTTIFSLWDMPTHRWHWVQDKPLPLLDAVLSMRAPDSEKRLLLGSLGLRHPSTFPHWKQLWEESSGKRKERTLRYAPERLCANSREMAKALLKLRPTQTIRLLQAAPQSVFSNEEVRDLLLALPAGKMPGYVKVWLEGTPPWMAKYADELLTVLDARPGLCKLLSKNEEWLPLIARTSHWDPAYLQRMPLDRVRGNGSRSPFSKVSMVRAAVLHPNAAAEEHRETATAYVNGLVQQRHLSMAAAEKLLSELDRPGILPRQHVRSDGWDTGTYCVYLYMVLASDSVRLAYLPNHWTALNVYKDSPELNKQLNLKHHLSSDPQPDSDLFESAAERFRRPAVDHLLAELQAQTWSSPEEFARTISLLEELMPERSYTSQGFDDIYFENVKVAVATAVELASAA